MWATILALNVLGWGIFALAILPSEIPPRLSAYGVAPRTLAYPSWLSATELTASVMYRGPHFLAWLPLI
jgi:hypothetical protein